MSKIDITKPVRTRDGRKVNDLSWDDFQTYCLRGKIEGNNKYESWTEEGFYQLTEPGRGEDLIQDDDPSHTAEERAAWVAFAAAIYPKELLGWRDARPHSEAVALEADALLAEYRKRFGGAS